MLLLELGTEIEKRVTDVALLINLEAVVLPWTELIAGLLVLLRPWEDKRGGGGLSQARGWLHRHTHGGALLLVSALVLSFIGLLTVTLLRGIDTSCGCFGAESSTVSWDLVARDVLLFLCVVPPWLSLRRSAGGERTEEQGVR